ncbi:MAG TPA: MarR family transcriptional regulator [Galbitalea sp.]|jgi:DNA-binding MarR family transcriptional regulator
MNNEERKSPVDPATVQHDGIVSITIDISGLLYSQAVGPVRLEARSLESVRELAGEADVAPLIGLVSRSVDFALGFLELPHFRVLILLSERDSMSVAEIVDAMKMPPRKTSTLLDSMENANWIYTAVSRRGVLESVAISTQGRILVDEVTMKRQQEIDEILQRMSEANRTIMAKAFSSFAAAANEPTLRQPKNGIAQ